jgi:hypothetical protein
MLVTLSSNINVMVSDSGHAIDMSLPVTPWCEFMKHEFHIAGPFVTVVEYRHSVQQYENCERLPGASQQNRGRAATAGHGDTTEIQVVVGS